MHSPTSSPARKAHTRGSATHEPCRVRQAATRQAEKAKVDVSHGVDLVFWYLQNLGVDATQLSVVSYGEEKPSDPNHSEDAFSKNRRAVLVY